MNVYVYHLIHVRIPHQYIPKLFITRFRIIKNQSSLSL